MMPCLSASRGLRPSPTSTASSPCVSVVSDSNAKSTTSISSVGTENISSLFVSRKKARTRRKRPQQAYNEAAAALSAIYPKIFPEKNGAPQKKKVEAKFWKRIEPLRFKEEAELLLHEVPTLIGTVREVEETELLCNEGTPPELKYAGVGVGVGRRQVSRLLANDDSSDSPDSKSEIAIPNSSPSWDGGSIEYEYFLDSTDAEIDAGIMSSIMGNDANPDFSETEEGLGAFGLAVKGEGGVEQRSEYGLQCSAIRSLRRTSDFMVCPVFDYSFPRLKLSDKILAHKERNAMSFSYFDWLRRDDSQHKVKLKLNYEDVLNAWSDRGPLYTEEGHCPQIVPYDSAYDPMVQLTHTCKSNLGES